MEQLANTIGTFEYDNLFAGGVANVVTDTVTVKSGQSYVRGTVIALDSEKKAVIVDSASADESAKVPYGILADDVDATTEDVPAVVYLSGEFNQNALVFGGHDTYKTHKEALRKIGIFLKENVKA